MFIRHHSKAAAGVVSRPDRDVQFGFFNAVRTEAEHGPICPNIYHEAGQMSRKTAVEVMVGPAAAEMAR
jgi:hypothetical protein